MFLHQFEQPQRPFAVEQKILVHHEKRLHLHVAFEPDHHLKQLVAGFVEINEMPLAAEHRRGRAEIAPHRATHGGDQCGRNVAGFFGKFHAHRAGADPRINPRMPDRLVHILAQKLAGTICTPSPRTTWSALSRSLSRGMPAICPPTMIFAFGRCSRISRHMISTLR